MIYEQVDGWARSEIIALTVRQLTDADIRPAQLGEVADVSARVDAALDEPLSDVDDRDGVTAEERQLRQALGV